jgi:signal transduction histidine kinase
MRSLMTVDMARWAPFGKRARTEIRYALVLLPVVVIGFVCTAVTMAGGVYLVVTLVGLPLIAAAVTGARRLGAVHRWLAARLLAVTVESPEEIRREPGVIGWIRSGLSDVAGWRAVAYLLLKGPLGLAAFVAVVAPWAYGLIFLSYPLWWWAVRPASTDVHGGIHHSALQLGDFFFDSWPHAFLLAGCGVVFLLAAPLAVHAVLTVDTILLRSLLGPTKTSQRIRHLEQTRAHAVEDSAVRLRRIERDLHDGAQVRLVTLAMHLGAAKERLAGLPDPDAMLSGLIGSAHQGAKDALDELRDLVRGIHPPILDNGLDAALATLATSSSVPVCLRVALPERPSPAIESIAYFCTAELLANLAKHSQARLAAVSVSGRGGLLRLVVEDDGLGGVRVRGHGGLAGLNERLGPVDGRLMVSSPQGGPTVVTVELPLHA